MRKLEVICDSEGANIGAYHIPTDLWADHLHFLNEAKSADKRNNARKRNRNLRCSILLLYGHFEGVVNEILEIIDEERIVEDLRSLLSEKTSSPEPNQRLFAKRTLSELLRLRNDLSSLCNKTLFVRFFVTLQEVKLPKLDYKASKDFRNLISHPPAKSPKETAKKEIWLDSYLYENLTVNKVEEDSKMIADWLEVVCGSFGISRLYDTEMASKEMAAALGTVPETKEV